MSKTQNFFETLQSFSDFNQFANTANYVEAPNDWYVILSDVSGSTSAIESGKYKEVNLIGAASVAVVQDVLAGEVVPFTFGGDGATLLVPPQKIEQAKAVLQKLICLAKVNYDFTLRVGIVPIREIYEAGLRVRVGKFKINDLTSIAMIKGGGLNWAEKKTKTEASKYCLTPVIDYFEVPHKLSCRWTPIKASRGKMLSLLVQPRENSADVAARIAEEIESLCEGKLESLNPIQYRNLKYDGLFKMLSRERKLHRAFSKDFLKRSFEIVLCWWAFKLKLPVPFAAQQYRESLRAHSDFRKYDDVLRMILDCTPTQVERIKSLLKNSFDKGEIFYGVHESSHALLTCLVENIQPGGHIHFVDGSAGGYALAAKQLKQQIANA